LVFLSFSKEEFLGNQFDVWEIGIEPNQIEVLNKIKGVEFSEGYAIRYTYFIINLIVASYRVFLLPLKS